MSSLRIRTSRALAWDLVGNYGGQIVSFVISIFLARLLGPEEFGLVGMSLVFISMLKIFTDLGFASALIQNNNNSSLTYSSIFYINVAAGFLLSSIIYLSAPWIGVFYNNETITFLVRLLSVSFIINAFGTVQATIFRKKLNFKVLTIRDLWSQILAGVVAVFFAFRGLGVYALVLQNILAALINTIVLWKCSEWHPKWEFSWNEVKKLSRFSTYVFAAQSINQLIVQADTLIIGKLFSPATLGFFSRAKSTSSLINKNSVRSIAKVFFPALSTLQNDEKKFEEVYLRVINLVAGISFFLTGIFFLCGEELIVGLFGQKWEPSVFIFKILVIKGFTYPISAMIVNAFMAKGKSKENFKYGNIRKVIQLFPFIFAYFYGFNEFLYALVVSSLVNCLLNNYFVSRSLNISFMLQSKAIFPHLVITSILVFIIYYFFPEQNNILFAAVRVVMFVLLYFIYLYISKSALYKEFLFYKNRIRNELKHFMKFI